MKFGLDGSSMSESFASPLRKTRGPAGASRLLDARSAPFARRTGDRRRPSFERRVRPAARAARREAGQHGGVCGLQRSGARHSRLQPVWGSATPNPGDDGYL